MALTASRALLSAAIDLQKMNWKFRTGFHEHTGVSLKEHLPNNPIGGGSVIKIAIHDV
jgi:hypothetical protein